MQRHIAGNCPDIPRESLHLLLENWGINKTGAQEEGLGQIFQYPQYHSSDLKLYLLSTGQVFKPDSEVETSVITGWCGSKTRVRVLEKDVQWKAGDDLETFRRLNAQDLGRSRLGRGGKEGLGEIQSPSQETTMQANRKGSAQQVRIREASSPVLTTGSCKCVFAPFRVGPLFSS